MQNEVKINQKHYGQLSVCNIEQDIVQVWMSQKDDPQVIQVERENIPALIQALSASYNNKKQPESKPNQPINLEEESPDFIKTDFVFVRYLNWSGVTKQQAIAADSEDDAREWLRNCGFKEIQVKQIYFKP